MSLKTSIVILLLALSSGRALALAECDVGQLCTIQTALFGCKDATQIKRWIDTYVEQDKDAAEAYIEKQVTSGECARFRAGDKLRITRYLGMRRIEVQRPGETQRFIMLLK